MMCEIDTNTELTGVRKKLTKLVPQVLLNLSGYKHAKRLGHISFERCLKYKNFSVQYQGAEIQANQIGVKY